MVYAFAGTAASVAESCFAGFGVGNGEMVAACESGPDVGTWHIITHLSLRATFTPGSAVMGMPSR
jgi:hypothetical protein